MIFFDQVCPKRVFPIKNGKSEHHYWIQLIRISLGNKFHLKLTILIFWTKFGQKEYSQSGMEKSHLCVCPSLLLTILNFSVRGPTVTWYFNVSSPFSRKDKKDREKRLIKKWCTISLLDIDFKMLSKSLAAHLKKVLPSLITHRQTVYVQIRCISKSGRLISCV